MQTIFFIGLGHMGLPMALNLSKAGYRVIGYDLQPEAVQRFVKAGGKGASHLNQAKEAQISITMLQTGEQVKTVCLKEEGLFASLPPGSLYLDCSSIDVPTSREITQAALQQQFEAVDAPVSGGVAGASAGTLTFMVGGKEETFQRAMPILSSMGRHVVYAGPAGNGQAAKICNNMILGVTMIAVSEAFLLGEKLGLAPQKLHEIVTLASGQCWVTSKYVPVPDVLPDVPANHDYRPGFTGKMMLKDLYLSQTSAEQAQLCTPMGAHATALYKQLNEAGLGDLDFSVIAKWLKS